METSAANLAHLPANQQQHDHYREPPVNYEAEQALHDLPPMVLPQHGLTRYLRVTLAVEDGVLR